MKEGKLYIVATPIGNMKDITFRAVEALKSSGLIIAEDTRVTKKLLNNYGIKTQLISYHKFNEKKRTEEIAGIISGGKDVSLVSDAGTPLISDPGFVIVRECINRGIEVVPVPGPSSVTASLVVSGFDPAKFFFCGFLDRKKAAKEKQLRELETIDAPVVIFEAPGRVKGTLAVVSAVLGSRRAAVVKEISKVHEKIYRGAVEEVSASIDEDALKGEFIIIIAPPDGEKGGASEEEVKKCLLRLMKEGKTKSDAVKEAAGELKVKKNTVYRIANKINE